jgi:hypothetical protein
MGALTSCGGEATKPAEAPASAKVSEEPAESSAEEASDAGSEAESAPPAACNDATCFSCGSGYCPSGWYCDESGSGGPACSWLPACGKASSCECVLKTLGKACSCEDQGGGPHVSCK